MPDIVVKDLIKVYGKGKNQVIALRGLSASVTDGELLAIVGPSGSGKTTLLHLIGGIDQPTAGTITVGGQDITEYTEKELAAYRREEVGIVFQFFNLVPDLTALENIEMPMRFARSLPARKERVRKLLDLVGLSERADHFPDELSGGEQQRVAIAVALANDPPILLADEPTGELDSEAGAKVVSVLRAASKKLYKTAIVVTHDAPVASIADRIARLRDGQIEAIEDNRPATDAHVRG